MKITVVYARPEKQTVYCVDVIEGKTVKDAIEASGVLQEFPDILLEKVGIFGKIVTLDTCLSEGDRVEIYRPLPLDPKEARKRRADISRGTSL